MFDIVYKIDANKFYGYSDQGLRDYQEFSNWLDQIFQLDLVKKEMDEQRKIEIIGNLQNWGRNVKKICPKSFIDSLFYIRRATISFGIGNYTSEAARKYVWPLFFEKFPLGNIWLIKISDEWWDIITTGELIISEKVNYKRQYPFSHPLEATGFKSGNFPFIALNFLAYGIYPLIFCDYINTMADLIFLYIPDRAFTHSEMFERRTTFHELLYSIQHFYGDEEFSDLFGRKKTPSSEIFLNPIRQFNYFDWFIKKVNDRMVDIIQVQDPIKREQLGMTFNRALLDAQLCIISELPYTFKTFFFGCLDKLSNLMKILNIESNERKAFKKLISIEFLENEVLELIKEIPDNINVYLKKILDDSIKIIQDNDLNPDYLRALRNSYHGYDLTEENFNILIKRDGEIKNDFTLIISPLILYFLSKKWNIS